MKNFLLSFSLLSVIVLFSFAAPNEDESIYVSKYIKYSVERDGGSALVTLDVANIEEYDEIYLKRSNNPTDDFRQVKYLSKNQVKELSQTGTIRDKYPLPGNVDSYYKVIAISNKGIYKLFPCVKLSKY